MLTDTWHNVFASLATVAATLTGLVAGGAACLSVGVLDAWILLVEILR